jgi:hypothetical protein
MGFIQLFNGIHEVSFSMQKKYFAYKNKAYLRDSLRYCNDRRRKAEFEACRHEKVYSWS